MNRAPAPHVAAALPLLLLLLLPAALCAQSVQGTLRSRTSGAGVEGATVVLLDMSGRVAVGTVTGPDGRFQLRAPGSGTYFLRAERIGFRTTEPVPLRFERRESHRRDLETEEQAVEVEGVEVEAEAAAPATAITRELQGFYERMANPTRLGYFIDREKLASYGNARLSEVLLSVPNVQMIRTPEGHYHLRFRRAAPSIYDRDCPPVWFLDGVPYPVEGDVDRQFRIPELEGIEIYSGARVPARFGGARAGCGVIALWTQAR